MDIDLGPDMEHYAELIKRPENDDDYTAFNIGGEEDHRLDETEVSLRRCVTLKHRDNSPEGWTSCDVAFYCGGVESRLSGLVADDLMSLGQALIDYAHRLRNY